MTGVRRLPSIKHFVEKLKTYCYFSSQNLVSEYDHIQMEESSIANKAFITPDGHFEYLRCRFGLCNALAVLHHTVKQVWKT